MTAVAADNHLTDLVDGAYRAILKREPDSEGRAHFLKIAADKGAEQVIADLLNSAEYLGVAQKDRLEIRDVSDFRAIIKPADPMFGCIIHGKSYEPFVMAPLAEACVGKRVLDIGANIGLMAVVAGRVAKSVVCVEPDPLNAKLVVLNAALNGVDNVTVLPFAVSDRFEMATFRDTVGTNRVVRPRDFTLDDIHEADVAMAMPIDAIVSEPFDVVKIDIEGREHAALKNASKLLDSRPIVFTEFSIHFLMDGSGATGEEYLNLFVSRDYEMTILHPDMRRENVGGDIEAVTSTWRQYCDRNWNHLDLVMTPRPRP